MILAREIARFCVALREGGWPAEVEEKLRVCLVNGFGMALAATDHPSVAAARTAVLAMDGVRPDGATLLCDGRRTSVAGAAMANSTIFYGGGQCDTCGTVHIGPIVLPLLLAMAETGAPTERLLPALLAAYETAGLLDLAYGVASAPHGFRATPVYGAIGAAAAVAMMLDLDVDQLASALSIAASCTGGLLQAFADGSDETRHQPGSAARTGLAAAQLAKAGVRGAPHAFEGKAGLIRAVAQRDCDVPALAAALGRDWSVLRVTFKPYPVCAFNQTPVTAAEALRDRVSPDEIAAVRVRMNPYETGYAGMDSKGPFTSPIATVMSIPFCIALTLVRGAPETMRPMMIYDDAQVNTLMQRIDLITDPSVPNLSSVIEIDLRDGRSDIQDQRMTAVDYGFSRPIIAAQVRRIGAEKGVRPQAYDAVERFVEALPATSVDPVVQAFAPQVCARAAA
jgi:2-methylcitrate dehydratase PrpD